jgi:DNA-binding MarR family transcriptional regulator
MESSDQGPRHHEATLPSFLGVARHLRERVAEVLERVDLTHPEYEVLSHLRAAPGGAGLHGIASALRVSPSMTSGLVSELAERGLLRAIAAGSHDEPAQVVLTPLGSARALEGRMQLDIVRLEFAARLRAPERIALGRLLAKVTR